VETVPCDIPLSIYCSIIIFSRFKRTKWLVICKDQETHQMCFCKQIQRKVFICNMTKTCFFHQGLVWFMVF